MKTSNNRKHFLRKLPPCIPNDCSRDIEWEDAPEIVKAAEDLAHRWRRWLKMKEKIDAEWKAGRRGPGRRGHG